jgi:hypothetical protein
MYEDATDAPTCRICFDSTGELLTPCKCKGSMQYAHSECLSDWYMRKTDVTCEICGYSMKYNEEPFLTKLANMDLWLVFWTMVGVLIGFCIFGTLFLLIGNVTLRIVVLTWHFCSIKPVYRWLDLLLDVTSYHLELWHSRWWLHCTLDNTLFFIWIYCTVNAWMYRAFVHRFSVTMITIISIIQFIMAINQTTPREELTTISSIYALFELRAVPRVVFGIHIVLYMVYNVIPCLKQFTSEAILDGQQKNSQQPYLPKLRFRNIEF